MAGFKYKRRVKYNSQSSPKVYFCCHQKDFELYFESISNEILDKQDCTVWYCEPETKRDEDFFETLEQMRLFVVPITTKLLSTDNDAFNVDFQFAISKHIPVLPLMQEKGIKELFKRKCGDIQYLDKNDCDNTAIAYDEKLEKYLFSVLVGSELANRVKDAFDAHIFLSYRKNDRRYAKELMRLIHNNKFCRDIGFWYDEFLTPGENFNDEISEMIEKCEIFALTLSPSIADPRIDEEGKQQENYIVKYEYPLARRLGRKVLPADFGEVEYKKLLKYENLPKCVKVKNEEEFSSALRELLGNIASNSKDDLKKEFLIGLAYLDGIDVEVDNNRAIELISKAAEHNVLEAIEKLVVMYRTGKGVKIDYKIAIYWQKKLVECLKNNLSPNSDIKDILKVMSELWYLGDCWYDVFNEDEARQAYEEMLSLGLEHKKANKKRIDEEDKSKLMRYISIAYEKIGNMYERKQEYNIALGYYTYALRIKKANKKINHIQYLIDLLNCYKRIGIIYNKHYKYNEALKLFRKCVNISNNIFKETGGMVYSLLPILKIGVIYSGLASKTKKLRYFNSAEKVLNQGIAIAKRILDENKSNDEAWEYMCHYNFSLAAMKIDTDKKERYLLEALNCINKSMELSESLWKLSFKSLTLNNLSICLWDKDVDESIKMGKNSLEIAERIYIVDQNPHTVSRYANQIVSVGYCYKRSGDLNNAREYYQKAVDLLRKNKDESPDVQKELVGALFMYSQLDDKHPDKGMLKEALKIIDSLIDKGYSNDLLILEMRNSIFKILSEE